MFLFVLPKGSTSSPVLLMIRTVNFLKFVENSNFVKNYIDQIPINIWLEGIYLEVDGLKSY